MKTTRHSSLKPISQAIKGIVIAASLGLAASPVAATPVTWDDIANDHMTTNNVLMYGLGTNAQRYPAEHGQRRERVQTDAGVVLLLR